MSHNKVQKINPLLIFCRLRQKNSIHQPCHLDFIPRYNFFKQMCPHHNLGGVKLLEILQQKFPNKNFPWEVKEIISTPKLSILVRVKFLTLHATRWFDTTRPLQHAYSTDAYKYTYLQIISFGNFDLTFVSDQCCIVRTVATCVNYWVAVAQKLYKRPSATDYCLLTITLDTAKLCLPQRLGFETWAL